MSDTTDKTIAADESAPCQGGCYEDQLQIAQDRAAAVRAYAVSVGDIEEVVSAPAVVVEEAPVVVEVVEAPVVEDEVVVVEKKTTKKSASA